MNCKQQIPVEDLRGIILDLGEFEMFYAGDAVSVVVDGAVLFGEDELDRLHISFELGDILLDYGDTSNFGLHVANCFKHGSILVPNLFE